MYIHNWFDYLSAVCLVLLAERVWIIARRVRVRVLYCCIHFYTCNMCMYTYVYTCMCICIHIYTYVYIYIERERDR